ncbi:MAG: phospholipase D-like domain-containing protein, partial [Sphingomonas sp.]
TGKRWDTPGHIDDDPRRVGPRGKPYRPWHDATMALEGPIAAALGELARERWRCATGASLPPVEGSGEDCWPPSLGQDFTAIPAAISRTAPDYDPVQKCDEIEALYLDMIARARRFIYAESQYFASRRIAQAIMARVREPDGPEIVLINPQQADGWLEQAAMDTARARLWESIGNADSRGRFRIYHPFTSAGSPIYVHAKIMIVDDALLRVGSSNWNNRSLGLDTECDITIDARGDAAIGSAIRAIREQLMAEHLGTEPAAVTRAVAETGGLVAAIERMRGPGRSLRPYVPPELNQAEKALADGEILDPESPDEMFEPLSTRGLFRRLRRPG